MSCFTEAIPEWKGGLWLGRRRADSLCVCVISLLSQCPCQHWEQWTRKPSRVQANRFTICWADLLLLCVRSTQAVSTNLLKFETWPRSSAHYYSLRCFAVHNLFFSQLYTESFFFPVVCIWCISYCISRESLQKALFFKFLFNPVTQDF